MAQIGSFTRNKDTYSGRIQTLSLDAELVLVPIDPGNTDNAPDYRIHLGSDDTGPEVGAAWKRTGEKAGDYLSLLIDDPAFVQPLRANLFKADDTGTTFNLLWTRPSRRDEKA